MNKAQCIQGYIAALLQNPSFLLMLAHQNDSPKVDEASIVQSGDTLVPNINPSSLARAIGQLEYHLNVELGGALNPN